MITNRQKKTKKTTKKPEPRCYADEIAVWCASDELADIESLIPFPNNPNKHPNSQIALYAKIIQRTGWRSALVRSNRSGYIVKGNGGLLAARLLGVNAVPVINQDFASEQEERAYLIADNRLAELGEIDRATLRELAEAMDDGGFDMELTGFDAKALEELMTAAPPKEKKPNFKEHNEHIDTDFECPKCAYKWSGKQNSKGAK